MWNSSRVLLAVRGFIYLFLILNIMSKLAFIHHSDAEQPEEEANPYISSSIILLNGFINSKSLDVSCLMSATSSLCGCHQ